MNRYHDISVRQTIRQSGNAPYIITLPDANRVGGEILLPMCEWGEAIREYVGLSNGDYVFFEYKSRLAFWESLREKRLMYQVKFRFVLRAG